MNGNKNVAIFIGSLRKESLSRKLANALIKMAPKTLEMGSQRIDDVSINIDPSRDPLTPDAVNLRIAVDGEFGNGTMELAPDGTVKSITPVKSS